ncbi:MAG: hypothetical protein ACLFSZ_03955 [Puniceicoccaceae bacterium]
MEMTVIGDPAGDNLINVVLTEEAREFSNTVFQLSRNGTEFRNFNPPGTTNLPKEPVANFATFYIQVPTNLFPTGEEPKILIKAEIGHSLGLEHYPIEGRTDETIEEWNRNVMVPTLNRSFGGGVNSGRKRFIQPQEETALSSPLVD